MILKSDLLSWIFFLLYDVVDQFLYVNFKTTLFGKVFNFVNFARQNI